MFDRPLTLRAHGAVLTLQGSVDEGSIAILRDRLTEMVRQWSGRHLTVDLSGVDYLPSAAIGVLVRARSVAREAGGALTILAPDGCPAQQVLVVTGIEHVTGLDEDDGPVEPRPA